MITAAEMVLETERRRFDRLLHEKDVELERAGRMNSEFLATMSHELRTPLTTVIGFSAALRDGLLGPMTEDQRSFSSDIFSSGHHLLALVDDMLELSKIARGALTLELEPVHLGLLLEHAVSTATELAAGTGASFELHTDANLGLVVLDRRKVERIVGHLLSNAVKFGARGRVVLKARRVSRGRVGRIPGATGVYAVPLPDNEFPEFLEVSVSDSGIGIAPDDLSTVFEPFTQIDRGVSRTFDGTGIGLALVRQLTEALGGAVAVASAAGSGACFWVWIPWRRPGQPGSS